MFKTLTFVCCLFILTACGGGSTSNGGGGNSTGTFSLSQTSVNFSGDINGMDTSIRPMSVDIQGSLQNASGNVYLFIDTSQTNLINDVSVIFSDAQAKGTLTLVPVSQNTLAPGTYTGDVVVHACKDENCKAEYSGSPKTIKINYTVTGPDYEIANNQVNFRMTYNNEFPEPVSVNMTSSLAVFNSSSIVSDDARKWLYIPIVWSEKSGTATFQITKQLPPGTYTTKVDLYAHTTSIRRSVNVTLIVDPEPFVVSTDDFRFILNGSIPIENQKRSVTVSSNSTNTQSWSIESDVAWISFSQNSGASGQQIDIALNDTAKQLSVGLHTGFIFIKTVSENTSTSRIPVSVYVNPAENTPENQEYKLNVKHSVIDKQRAKLYVVDDITKTLFFIDLKIGVVEKYIPFIDYPNHLFITKDNAKLYLSLHMWNESNTSIVEINLDTQTLASSFLIDIYAENFIVTKNNKLIAEPGHWEFYDVNSYEIPSGRKTGNFYRVFTGGKTKLDTTENYLYVLEPFTSFHLTKFDISATPYRQTVSTQSSDFASDFWITPDDSTIITSFGELFSSSLNRGTRIFNQGEFFISMDFNPSNNTTVAIASRSTGTKLMTFSLNSFTVISESSIDANIGDSIYIANGKTYLISIEGFDFDKFLQIKSI